MTAQHPPTFFAWSADDAREAVADLTPAYTGIVRLFLEGDHWQDGDGWVGPAPMRGEEGFTEVMSLIETAFVSRNVIAEVLNRHKNGVLGKEPRWRFVPRAFRPPGEAIPEAEATAIAQLESLLTEWWNGRQAVAALQQATLNVLMGSRSVLRLYVPRGVVGEAELLQLKRGDLASALQHIWIDAPDPEAAAIYEDPNTKQSLGIVIEEPDENGNEIIHLFFLDPSTPLPRNGKPSTVHMIVDPSAREGVLFYFDFNGLLPLAQLTRPRFISEQTLKGQKALNLAISMIPRTVTQSGFLERTLLGAQMPGEWTPVKDSSGNVTGRRFTPSQPVFGAGHVNYVAPIVIEADDGRGGTKQVMSSPDIRYHEPSDPKFAIVSKLSHYQDILEETNQSHILITSDATPSGMSREQARSEYEDSLEETKPTVDAAGRTILDALVAMAEQLAGVPGLYSSRFRAIMECNVDTGPISADEKRQNTEAATGGFMSNQMAMELNGIEDVDAEAARIKAEGLGNVAQLGKRVEILAAIKTAGIPPGPIMRLLGFSPEDITEVEDAIAADKKAEADAKAKQPLTSAAP